jgi:transcriptional regulator with AAA-type ATPase domain
MSTSELIGSSRKLSAVLEDVRTVAGTSCAVLIQGETGTGKELVANALAQGRFTEELDHSFLEDFARTNRCPPVQLTSRAEDAVLSV